MCHLHCVVVSDDKHLVVDGGAVLFWFTFLLLLLLLISYRCCFVFVLFIRVYSKMVFLCTSGTVYVF